MNTETGQIEMVDEELAATRRELVPFNGHVPRKVKRAARTHDQIVAEREAKPLARRVLSSLIKQSVRANRSKYIAHVGEKQLAKAAAKNI